MDVMPDVEESNNRIHLAKGKGARKEIVIAYLMNSTMFLLFQATGSNLNSSFCHCLRGSSGSCRGRWRVEVCFGSII